MLHDKLCYEYEFMNYEKYKVQGLQLVRVVLVKTKNLRFDVHRSDWGPVKYEDSGYGVQVRNVRNCGGNKLHTHVRLTWLRHSGSRIVKVAFNIIY